jgi:outer membrane protein TolC
MNRTGRVVLVSAVCVLAPSAVMAQTLTLREVVSLALRNDPRVAEANIRQQSASREADFTGARFGPNLFTGTGALYTYGLPQTPGGALPSILNLGFTQTVYDAVARGRHRVADEQAEVQKLAASSTRQTVMLQAAAAYLELVAVRRSLDRLRPASDSARRIVALDIDRLNEGRALPLDVLRARLSAAQIDERVTSLESRDTMLEGQLRLLTGLPADRPILVSGEDLPASPERSVPELVAAARTNRDELKAAEFEARARRENVAGQRGAYFPTVDLVGNYAMFSRFNNLDTYFSRFQRNSVNAGIEARVPIFSAQTSAAVALAESQSLEADLAVKRQRDEIDIQVRQTAQQAREADAHRTVAELELAVAQETVRLAEARFAEGRADRLDRETAIVGEARAWDSFYQADWARQKAQLELRQATGELGRLFP